MSKRSSHNLDSRLDPELAVPDLVDDSTKVVDESLAESSEVGDELCRLRAELAESEKRTLLAIAELENFRKRSSKNFQEQTRYAALPVLTELLEIVDNLDRAIENVAVETDRGLIDGLKMVSEQIRGLLNSQSCQAIESVGHAFDPNLHQAVQMQPSYEYPANVVTAELRTGYVLHDRVIRPAQVLVSTGPAN
jgi:molecular chaperone GrpE